MTVYCHYYGRTDKAISFIMHQRGLSLFLERNRRPPGLSKFELVRDGDKFMLAYRVSHYEIESQRTSHRPNFIGGGSREETITHWKPAFHTWDFVPFPLRMDVVSAETINVPPTIKVGEAVQLTLELPKGTAFSLDGAPDGMILEPTTHVLRFTPQARHMGRYIVNVMNGDKVHGTFKIKVAP